MGKPVAIKGTDATLAGVPLLASAPIRWRLASGVLPVIETFEVQIKQVPFFEKIGDRQQPIKLVIGAGTVTRGKAKGPAGVKDLVIQAGATFENLRVITAEPGPNPFIGRITVGDVRWLWPYRWHISRYNLRKRGGVVRRLIHGDANLDPVVQDFQFRNWSLLIPEEGVDGAWEALLIVFHVLATVSDVGFDGDSEIFDLKALSVENIEIDDGGENAMRRALALLPGLDVFVNQTGIPHLYSKFDFEREERQITIAGPEIIDGGHVERISASTTRPAACHVLYNREIEVRLDFDWVDFKFIPEERRLENVVAIPDADFTIDDERVAQGTYVEIRKYIAALVEQAGPAGRLRKFSEDILAKAAIPGMGIWAMIEMTGLLDISKDAEKNNWRARFEALRNAFLTLFRIPISLNERVLTWRADLVGTIDNTTGERGPSPVWANHALWTSLKGLVLAGNRGGKFCLATNVFDGNAAIILNGKETPSPIEVQIVDSEQGIIRLQAKTDIYGQWDKVIPGPMINVPCFNPEEKLPLTFDSVIEGEEGRIPAIDLELVRITTILTALPAAPNDLRQLHAVIVNPEDVVKVLPAGAKRGLLNAKGPIKFLREKTETARVVWLDESEDVIMRCFGFNGDPPEREEIAPITINDRPGAGIKEIVAGQPAAASLESLSLARAAQVYSLEQDRLQGGKTVPMNGTLRPAGFISEIRHALETDGTAVTMLSLPEQTPGFDVEAFLDEQTRRILNREAMRK